MNFADFCRQNGFDAETLTDSQRGLLQSAYERATAPPPPVAQPVVAEKAPEKSSPFSERVAAIERENARHAFMENVALQYMQRNIGNNEKCHQLRDLAEAAKADEKMDERGFELAMLRLDRDYRGLTIAGGKTEALDEEVFEAALCRSHNLKNVEKKFSARALELADRTFKRGCGLHEMLFKVAQINGNYRGSFKDVGAMWRAAMTPRADGGPSAVTTPQILSNTANKFLEQGFFTSPQDWRGMARVTTANDYKQITRIRMTGSNIFQQVPASGEIPFGSISELYYNNQVAPYAIQVGLSEQQLRNDDLQAFADLNVEIGRGGGDAINRDLWAEWLDDSAFFPTDKSLDNYDDGATDSVLSLAGLDNAETIFRLQTKPDGTPVGIKPAVLLVPATLANTAAQLMNSMILVVGTTAASGPNANVFQGRYTVVSSEYLDGTSTTAWYLLADPNVVAAMEIAFLDGVQTPQVDSFDWEPGRLGMTMQGVLRYGVSKQEYRAGVKLKGAA